MQPSNGDKPTKTRKPHSVAVVVSLVALLALTNFALCFALQPYGSPSDLAWNAYRTTEDVDTLFVGASLTQYTMDPYVFDQELGSSSINMSIPGLPFRESLTAIKAANDKYDLKRVVIVLGYTTMAESLNIGSSASAVCYTQARCVGEPPATAVGNMVGLFTDKDFARRPESVVTLFPWAFSHVGMHLSDIKTNIHNRLTLSITDAAAHNPAADDGYRYVGRGYGNAVDTASETSEHTEENAEERPFVNEHVEGLRRICTYCKEQNIELYVVGVAYMPTIVMQYGDDYARQMSSLQELVTQEGAHYFDLSMAHRDILDTDLSCFQHDRYHPNGKGAVMASRLVAQLAKRIEAGEDVSELFYDYSEEGQAAWRDSIDFVDAVEFDWGVTSDHIWMDAHADTGPKTPVEYHLKIKDAATGKWTTVQDWAPQSHFEFAKSANGRTDVRLYARSTNGRQDKNRCVKGTLAY